MPERPKGAPCQGVIRTKSVSRVRIPLTPPEPFLLLLAPALRLVGRGLLRGILQVREQAVVGLADGDAYAPAEVHPAVGHLFAGLGHEGLVHGSITKFS